MSISLFTIDFSGRIYYLIIMNKLLTIKKVAEYLDVCIKTVRRLIEQSKLPASKIGGQWRVKPEDLELFVKRRLLFLDEFSLPPVYFRLYVLEQYRKDEQYFVHESGFYGRIGKKEDYRQKHITRSYLGWTKNASGKDDFNTPGEFAEIPFWKVRLNNNEFAIVLDPRRFYALPVREQKKWMPYLIPKPEI